MELKINKEWFKKFFAPRPKKHSELGVNSDAHWKYILIFFIVLNLLQFAGHFYLWRAINKQEIFQVVQTEQTPLETINRETLDAIIERFEAKERAFEKLELSAPAVSDPSR